MASTHSAGPDITYGAAVTLSNSHLTEAGPDVTYQGAAVIDPRFVYKPGATGVGHVRAFEDSPYILSVDAVPSALSTTIIAASQAATSGTALTLASANAAGIGVNYPVVPTGKGVSVANTVSALVLDPGFTTAGTTSGSAVLTLTAATIAVYAKRFKPGSALLVGSAAATWTAARVLAVTSTTVTLDTPMPTTNASAVVALANGQFKLSETPLAASYSLTAGAAQIFDPRSNLSRGVSVTTAGANTGGTVTVSGYDVFMNPMSETIACATAATFYGNKAFKYVVSAVPAKTGGGAMTGNISVGTSDLFGFATRADQWEYTNVLWGSAWMTNSTGWYAPDYASPATATTKDVRGVVQVSANGPNGSGIGSNASNGARRLTMFMSIPADNVYAADALDASSLFGTVQA